MDQEKRIFGIDLANRYDVSDYTVIIYYKKVDEKFEPEEFEIIPYSEYRDHVLHLYKVDPKDYLCIKGEE